MHLKKELLKLGIEATLEKKSDTPIIYEAKIKIPASLKFFEGHFPSNPILPAFAAIEISLEIGRSLKLLPQQIKKIPNAKFLNALKPETEIKILIRRYDTSIDFEWQHEEESQWKKACDISIEV
ncbi:MAG: hypothetical protein R3A80_04025 [Bdellovibrionota bacterium]